MALLLFALFVACVVAALLWQRQRRLRREAYIREFVLPRGLFEKLRAQHPALSARDCQLVAQALRQFFLAHLKSGRQFVSMPSQVVDDLWHQFILYTRHYELFCRQAFGRFMHHTPAVVLAGGQQQSNAGLRRCWWFACREENIDPRRASRLPLLFAIDAKLAIPGGFHYVPDCAQLKEPRAGEDAAGCGATAIYCGGDFSSPGFDGSTDGFGPAGDGGAGAAGSDGAGGSGGGTDGGADGGSSGDGGGSSGSGSGCGGGGCGGGGS